MTHSLTRKGQHSSRRFFERQRRQVHQRMRPSLCFAEALSEIPIQMHSGMWMQRSDDLFLSRHCPSLLVQRNYAVVFFCATTKKEARRARRARCLSRTVIAAKLRCTT